MGPPKMNALTLPFRLAASDLDGTLLGPHKDISPANVAAVRRLQAAGLRVILASGRRHQNSLRYQRELGLQGPLISCAGALVRDTATNEILREVFIPADLAETLVERGDGSGFTVIYYHRDHLYVSATNHWTELYESRVGEKAERLATLRDLHGEGALKIVWYGQPAAIRDCRAKLEAEFTGKLSVVSTDAENLEFLAAGADKARALAAVCERLGVPQERTLAFGDGENDAPMLRWAGCGVAMDGGSDIAKQAADLVTPTGDPANRLARGVDAVFASRASEV